MDLLTPTPGAAPYSSAASERIGLSALSAMPDHPERNQGTNFCPAPTLTGADGSLRQRAQMTIARFSRLIEELESAAEGAVRRLSNSAPNPHESSSTASPLTSSTPPISSPQDGQTETAGLESLLTANPLPGFVADTLAGEEEHNKRLRVSITRQRLLLAGGILLSAAAMAFLLGLAAALR